MSANKSKDFSVKFLNLLLNEDKVPGYYVVVNDNIGGNTYFAIICDDKEEQYYEVVYEMDDDLIEVHRKYIYDNNGMVNCKVLGADYSK